jgi:dTDP-glucose pyrophosphorylase
MDEKKFRNLLVSPNTTVKKAMSKLSETAEKILFVADEKDTLLGTATDGDIRRALLNGLSFTESLDKVMCTDFVFVEQAGGNIRGAAKKLMLAKKIEQIPILNENGRIVDVVIWTDFFEKREETSKEVSENLVVIMAGGKGTRLDPFTKILPKALIPLGNQPVIELIMERFYKCGFHKFTYTLNYKKEYIRLFLKENSYPYSIDWVEEEEFLGTAGSIRLIKDKLDDTFFVVNCDSLLELDFKEVLAWHQQHDAAITIIGCHNEVRIPFGVLQTSNGRLERILEKPVHDVLINTGVYVCEPRIISYIPEKKCIDMNELIERVSQEDKVTVYPIQRGWLDIGQWEEYRKALDQVGAM